MKVLSIDSDINREFQKRFHTDTEAVAILFRRGVELARLPGAFSEEALVSLIDDNYERAPMISKDEASELPKQPLIVELIESDFKTKVLDSKLPVLLLVSHSSSYSGPYKSMRSVLEEIARNNPDTISILWLNTGDNFLLADKLDSADSHPHLFLFKNGKKQRRIDGNASEDAIMGMLEGYVTLR